ncbi:hypothetical protein ES705_34840 [subsurface metagenome]
MHNRKYAIEWIDFARRNLDTAKLLFQENHYTDIIAIEIHQTIEKSFKAVLAYNGIKLPRTHNLTELYKYCGEYFDFTDLDIDDLIEINDYYEDERYPGPKYSMPTKEEISKNLEIAEYMVKSVSNYIKQ